MLDTPRQAPRVPGDDRTRCDRCGFATKNPDELRKFSKLRLPNSARQHAAICGRCTQSLMGLLEGFVRI